jgi:hypothetical protein
LSASDVYGVDPPRTGPRSCARFARGRGRSWASAADRSSALTCGLCSPVTADVWLIRLRDAEASPSRVSVPKAPGIRAGTSRALTLRLGPSNGNPHVEDHNVNHVCSPTAVVAESSIGPPPLSRLHKYAVCGRMADLASSRSLKAPAVAEKWLAVLFRASEHFSSQVAARMCWSDLRRLGAPCDAALLPSPCLPVA